MRLLAAFAACIVLAGCADPSASAPAPPAEPAPDPFAPMGEPWLVWLEGCGRCRPEQAVRGLLVTHDGSALWWSFDPFGSPGPDGGVRMPSEATHLQAAVEVVRARAHPEPQAHAWQVHAAFTIDLGGWSDLHRALAENETAAHLHGEPEPAGCHDCAGAAVLLWPDGPAHVVEGYDRSGWSGLSLLLGDIARTLGPHQEAS